MPRNIIGTSRFSTGRYHAGPEKAVVAGSEWLVSISRERDVELFSNFVNGSRRAAGNPPMLRISHILIVFYSDFRRILAARPSVDLTTPVRIHSGDKTLGLVVRGRIDAPE